MPLDYVRSRFEFPSDTLQIEVDGHTEIGSLLALVREFKGPVLPSAISSPAENAREYAVPITPYTAGVSRYPTFGVHARAAVRAVSRLFVGENAQAEAALDSWLRSPSDSEPWDELAELELTVAAMDFFTVFAPVPGENPADVYAVARRWIADSDDASNQGGGTVSGERDRLIGLWISLPGNVERLRLRTSALRGLMSGELLGPERVTTAELLDPSADFDPVALQTSALVHSHLPPLGRGTTMTREGLNSLGVNPQEVKNRILYVEAETLDDIKFNTWWADASGQWMRPWFGASPDALSFGLS